MPSRDDRTISEMRNLGPACENDLKAAGIYDAQDVLDLGVEDAFIRILIGRKHIGRSDKCCSALYLYALHGAIYDVDWRNIPQQKKEEYKKLAAELRRSR